MIEFVQTVLALIVTISILVTIHEFGHYWVARLCNVHVLRFSVGFGKPFFMRRGRAPDYTTGEVLDQDGNPLPIRTRSNEPLDGTEFAIAAIPLGLASPLRKIDRTPFSTEAQIASGSCSTQPG